MNFEIIYGLRAVWVNDATGACLGRFGIYGIDVHHTIDKQEETGQQCLLCTHGPNKSEDWPRFTSAMFEFHQIDIRQRRVPDWL